MERGVVPCASNPGPAGINRRQFVLRGAALGAMLTGSSSLLTACGGGHGLHICKGKLLESPSICACEFPCGAGIWPDGRCR